MAPSPLSDLDELTLVVARAEALRPLPGVEPAPLVELPAGYRCAVVREATYDCVTRALSATGVPDHPPLDLVLAHTLTCLGLAAAPGWPVAQIVAGAMLQTGSVLRDGVVEYADVVARPQDVPRDGRDLPVRAALRWIGVAAADGGDEAAVLGLELPRLDWTGEAG